MRGEKKSASGNVLGFDYGRRYIGVALVQELVGSPRGLCTLERKKRKTLKNRKKRVMKGGSLSEWRNKHPELYTEALSTGIDHRTLENAYRSMTLGMTEGEKFSYDKNNLNSKTDILVNGGTIPPPFQEQVNLMIKKQSASDAKKIRPFANFEGSSFSNFLDLITSFKNILYVSVESFFKAAFSWGSHSLYIAPTSL